MCIWKKIYMKFLNILYIYIQTTLRQTEVMYQMRPLVY